MKASFCLLSLFVELYFTKGGFLFSNLDFTLVVEEPKKIAIEIWLLVNNYPDGEKPTVFRFDGFWVEALE